MASWWLPFQNMEMLHMPWTWHSLHLPERPGRGKNRQRFMQATRQAKLKAQAAAQAMQQRLGYLHLDETLFLGEAREKARQGARAVQERLRWTSKGARLAAAKGAKAVRERLEGIQNAKAVQDRLKRLHSPSARIARDKYAWTLGVFVLMLTEFFAVNQRAWLKWWYTFLILSMYLIRLKNYHTENLHYFLIDFCYIGNFLLLFYLHFYPNSVVLFQVVFALSTGPITVAILAWRNSLVFHNLDKMTTVVVHVMPPLVVFVLRWFPDETTHGQLQPGDSASLARLIFIPLLVYLYWQVCYLLKTEVVDAKRLHSNPQLWTSARWLSKHGGDGVVGKVVNMYGKQEARVNRTLMAVQFIYTAVTLLPMKLFYASMAAHGLYLLVMLFFCVHNGASYYFDVFSRKYYHAVMTAPGVDEQEALAADQRVVETEDEVGGQDAHGAPQSDDDGDVDVDAAEINAQEPFSDEEGVLDMGMLADTPTLVAGEGRSRSSG